MAITVLPVVAMCMFQPLNNSSPKIAIHSEKIIGDRLDQPNITDPSETIYDLYSQEEIEILWRIVEAECTGASIEDKMNVANAIINRVNNDEFPSTIKEVVFQKTGKVYQFSPIADRRYYSVEITDETKQACEQIFTQKDTTDGAIYFHSSKGSNWISRNRTYLFSDNSHKFYK